MMNSTLPLILGSNSPRRKQILSEAGYSFETMSADVDEGYPPDLDKKKIAVYLAEIKNKHYRKSLQGEVLITADTTVILQDESLEKPADSNEAIEMLSKLSGQKHEVITGFSISNGVKQLSSAISTSVFFKDLARREIVYYVENYKPFDKAGAYGIQEWIGMIGIEKIEGSYFNVMGLPIFEMYESLKSFEITPIPK